MPNDQLARPWISPDNTTVHLNGKTYTLLHYYQLEALGPFFIAVAGRVPLKRSDLADHWLVRAAGHAYIGLQARPFSYHLLGGLDVDLPRDWPAFKNAPQRFAFVGPSDDAVTGQLRLILDTYRLKPTLDALLRRATRVPDRCGGPDALVIRYSYLKP
jgi:hypothetical protein